MESFFFISIQLISLDAMPAAAGVAAVRPDSARKGGAMLDGVARTSAGHKGRYPYRTISTQEFHMSRSFFLPALR
jgi:hypothetical protein